MDFSLSWLLRPAIAIASKLIVIDKSIIPTITLVGSSDKSSKNKMKVIKLTFNPDNSSIIIRDIYSQDKLYSASADIKTESDSQFNFIGFVFSGDSNSSFIYKEQVIFSEQNEEILFSVFDTGKPTKVIIKYSFFKRYTFFV